MRVGLIFGGQSPEHEVSIATARNVAAAIDRDRWIPVPIGVARNGTWLITGDPFQRLVNGEEPSAGQAWLSPWEEGADEVEPPDIFMPLIHGAGGEDGRIQGYLDTLGLPYSGGSVLPLACGMDKWLARNVWSSTGLTTVPFVGVTEQQWRTNRELVQRSISRFGLPLFTKPANLGSSIGVRKVHKSSDVPDAVEHALAFDERILVEPAIDAREIEVGILASSPMLVSEPGEVLVAGDFYSFHEKYVSGRSSSRVPAKVSQQRRDELRGIARQAFESLDGDGMARVDFFVCRKTDTAYLNEINFVPGFTDSSMYPNLMATVGLNYTDLISALLDIALERNAKKRTNNSKFASGDDWFHDGPRPQG